MSTYCYNLDRSDTSKVLVPHDGNVPQLSSELVILTFMYEYEIPLQPKALYGGLINQQNITFSYRTVQNKVADLTESKDIERVIIDTKDGKIKPLNDENSRKRAYYLITEQGRNRFEREVI